MRSALALAFLLSLAPAFAQDGLHAYLGSLHDHTSEGGDDGKGTVAEAIAAVKTAGYQFQGISPHDHMIQPATYTAFRTTMDAADQPGTFVTFPSFEWGTISKGGHVGVIGSHDLITNASTDWDGFWQNVIRQPEAFVVLNHPVWGRTYGGTPTAERIARAPLMEVLGGPGQYDGPSLAGKGEASHREYVISLNAGWRSGVVYGEDNHSGRWGTVNRTRTGVWASALTRPALTEALKARRTFVTEDPAMTVWIEAGATPMGGDAPAGDATLTVKVTHASEAVTDVALFVDPDGPGGRLAGEVARFTSGAFTAPVHPTSPGAFAFVVARDASGDLAWSSPIFFGSAPPRTASAEEKVDLNFFTPVDLDRVSGVGKGTVKLLTEARKNGMVFERPEDLAKVPGLSAELAAKIIPHVMVTTPEETADQLTSARLDRKSLVLDDKGKSIAGYIAERAERLLALQLAPFAKANDLTRVKSVLARLDRAEPLPILKASAMAAEWGSQLESALK